MRKINLKNRDGFEIVLREDSKNIFTLDSDVMLRIMEDGDEIVAIDPPGGPLLSLGSVIDNLQITKFITPYKIEMHENDNN